MRLSPSSLESWVGILLARAGLSVEDASRAAHVFRLASERGLGHHDISYLPQRLDWLASGRVSAKAIPEAVSAMGGTEVWEGHGGLGEVLCHHVTHRAMSLAREHGIGYAAVRHSNHFLAAAPYTEMGSREGFLTLVWSNTDAGMAFPGQNTRQIGNNPLGYAVGTGDSGLSADLCLAYSSLGNLHVLQNTGKEAPSHWGLDAEGRGTTDAKALLAGAVGPIAGPKGLALALLGEVLTGVLAGGPTLDQIAPAGGLNTHNQAVLAWDLSAFGGRAAVEDRVKSLKQRAQGMQGEGRLPGERSRLSARDAQSAGVSIDAATWQSLTAWSQRWQVDVPQPYSE